MTTRIDELNTRYFIPGMDLGSAAATANAEEIEEDYLNAPFSQIPSAGDMPSPTGWQDLLGLNQIPPGPRQIDPPPRPVLPRHLSSAYTVGDYLRVLRTLTAKRTSAVAPAPKFEQMIGILDRYQRAARAIRARATGSGGQ